MISAMLLKKWQAIIESFTITPDSSNQRPPQYQREIRASDKTAANLWSETQVTRVEGRRSTRVKHVPLICNVWTASSIGLNTSSDRFEQHLQFVWAAFTITIETSLQLANSRLTYLASVSVRHCMTRIYAQRKHNHWFVCPIHVFVVNDSHTRNWCH